MNYDLINKLSDIEESLSPAGFLFKENNDYVTFYKTEFSEKRAPEVTECIKGTVMQIEKALINDRLRVSKVS